MKSFQKTALWLLRICFDGWELHVPVNPHCLGEQKTVLQRVGAGVEGPVAPAGWEVWFILQNTARSAELD